MSDNSRSRADLRLGWLEAFVAVTRHRSYEAAAAEIGVHPTNVQRAVEALERWLGKVLVTLERPLELVPPYGEEFLPVAQEVLRLFATHPSVQSADNIKTRLSTGRSARSNVRLQHLEAFVAVADERVYKKADWALDWEEGAVRRDVKALEAALNAKLIEGHSQVRLTGEGAAFLCKAKYTISVLLGQRADNYDLSQITERHVDRLYWLCVKRRLELELFISRCGQAGKLGKSQKEDLLVAQHSLKFLEGMCDALEKEFGDFTQPSDHIRLP